MNLRDQIAGLLSTIPITPARRHPDMMQNMADQVLTLIDEFQPDDGARYKPDVAALGIGDNE